MKKASDYQTRKKKLTEDLNRGVFAPCYLIYGDEDYLRFSDLKFILKKLDVTDGDMNFTKYSGQGTRADEVIETAMTHPFFASSRVVLIEDSGWLAARKKSSRTDGKEEASAGSEDGKRVAEYLKNPSPETRLIFMERDVNRTTSLFKAIEKYGFTLSCDQPSAENLKKWMAKRFANNGMNIELKAAERLLALSESGQGDDPRLDMNMLYNEIEKLVSYCMGKDAVRIADVEAVCSVNLTDRVFDMVEMMAKKDLRGASACYQDMLQMKHPPMMILALITRRFNDIMRVKEMLAAHRSHEEIASTLSIHPYVVKLCSGWAGSFTKNKLADILKACADSEAMIKTGRMTDLAALESLIVICAT